MHARPAPRRNSRPYVPERVEPVVPPLDRRKTGPHVLFRAEEAARRDLDRAIATRADEQYGVVALHQLEMIGLTGTAVRKRVAAGRLIRLYRGVFAVGHQRLTIHGRWLAAVLVLGHGAVLSHRS